MLSASEIKNEFFFLSFLHSRDQRDVSVAIYAADSMRSWHVISEKDTIYFPLRA